MLVKGILLFPCPRVIGPAWSRTGDQTQRFGGQKMERRLARLFITTSLLVIIGLATAQDPFLALCRDASHAEIQAEIAAGADLTVTDEYGQTPLVYAASGNQDPEVFTLLKNSGVDLNARTGAGWTALMYAVRYNPNPAVILRLLDLGADPKIRNTSGLLALNYAGENPALANSPALVRLEVLTNSTPAQPEAAPRPATAAATSEVLLPVLPAG